MILYLLDIDGTLLACNGAGRRAFEQTALQLLGAPNATAGIAFGGRTDQWLVAQVFANIAHRPPTASELTEFENLYVAALRAELAAQPPTVFESVGETVDWLLQQPDICLGVATGNWRSGADAKLEAAGLGGFAAFGGWGCDAVERHAIVGTAIARGTALAQRAGTAPVASVVIGDTPHDVSAARQVGARICAVTTGGDSVASLAGADAIWDRLKSVIIWHADTFRR